MMKIDGWDKIEFSSIPEDIIWNTEQSVLKMHSVHAYPAKFPPYLANSAFEYAEQEGVNISSVADVFCGCGTVALEAKKRNKDFWGCDINPVATLISSVKSSNYDLEELRKIYLGIEEVALERIKQGIDYYQDANERLKYWYNQDQYNALFCLHSSIVDMVEEGAYRDAFMCVFSSILKRTSRWLQKSIKPQIDPKKSDVAPLNEFKRRYQLFYEAVDEIKNEGYDNETDITIVNESLFDENAVKGHMHDLIVTSPPYVTSYEYADLHQLSLLWLKYCENYKDMREGTVGSSYNHDSYEEQPMNEVANAIVDSMREAGLSRSKYIPVARYYRDMENTVRICKNMMNDRGMTIFVIGDSVIKGIKLENSKHLIKAMSDEGFSDIKISKRKVSKGICVPFRDRSGRFTKKKQGCKEIYHVEYVISGRV